MLIELHAIQSFGPTNLNRDDTGNPKEALFGGVRRARISSQSAKRAMRVSNIFAETVNVPTGKRTKLLVDQIVKALHESGVDEIVATEYAQAVAIELYSKLDKRKPTATSVAVYFAQDELNAIIQYFFDARDQNEEPDVKALGKDFVKVLANRTSAPDIALFGRMLAENPKLNIDAACQMAHALSTHEVNSAEFDYFTAVDDYQPDEDAGASMLGLVPYNSATYYRNARIDYDQLLSNLGGDVELAHQTIDGFMKAFALVVPTGMKNSFVNQHAPDFLMAVVRPKNDGQSLLNAFEQPVRARNKQGYVQASIEQLTTYWDQVEGVFRLHTPRIAVLNPRDYALSSLELTQASVANLPTWVNTTLEHISHSTEGA